MTKASKKDNFSERCLYELNKLTMTNKDTRFENLIIERLAKASVCCADCGEEYGRYAVGCSSMWEGTCDVCGDNAVVTETRDWGYLIKGRAEYVLRKISRLSDSNR